MFHIRSSWYCAPSRFIKQLSVDSIFFHHTTPVRCQLQENGHSRHIDYLLPRLCGPSVKKLLTEYEIEPSNVPNSGPRGNVLKGDVLSYIQNKKLQFTPITSKKPSKKVIAKGKRHDDVAMLPSAKAAARQSVLSKTTIPHAYMNVDCSLDAVYEYQERMKRDGTAVSLNDFIVKSAASALRKLPEMNVTKQDGRAKALSHINVAVTKADNTSTVVRKADALTVQLISELINSVQVEPREVSIRVFDLGQSGVSDFRAVIRPPEVAVLAVGAPRCVFEESGFRQKIKMTLSFDNEVVSDQTAALFVGYFKEHLENPLSNCLP